MPVFRVLSGGFRFSGAGAGGVHVAGFCYGGGLLPVLSCRKSVLSGKRVFTPDGKIAGWQEIRSFFHLSFPAASFRERDMSCRVRRCAWLETPCGQGRKRFMRQAMFFQAARRGAATAEQSAECGFPRFSCCRLRCGRSWYSVPGKGRDGSDGLEGFGADLPNRRAEGESGGNERGFRACAPVYPQKTGITEAGKRFSGRGVDGPVFTAECGNLPEKFRNKPGFQVSSCRREGYGFAGREFQAVSGVSGEGFSRLLHCAVVTGRAAVLFPAFVQAGRGQVKRFRHVRECLFRQGMSGMLRDRGFLRVFSATLPLQRTFSGGARPSGDVSGFAGGPGMLAFRK